MFPGPTRITTIRPNGEHREQIRESVTVALL
jgi:hypothetical protein